MTEFNPGKVILTNLTNLSKNQYDEALLIVRSASKIPQQSFEKYRMTQVKELSPSSELFGKYLELRRNNNWNEETFDTIYVPQFIDEIVNGSSHETFGEKGHELNQIHRKVMNGKTIAIVCFCDNEFCHRYIVGGLLSGVGLTVVSDRNIDIEKYYRMYIERRKTRV